ncbi:nuclease [Kocuria palustris]|uniref:nuclease n=1 Tax=Kocuria palustris TaxID=71999 RepID=UPI0028CB32FC|nr:nuclease [Kocuria palustris]
MVPHESTQFGTRRSDSAAAGAAPLDPAGTAPPSDGTTTAPEPATAEAPSTSGAARQPVTYLLVDGENIDATLGMSLLERKPKPEERPRWEKVMKGARKLWNQDTNGLFFLNGSNGHLPFSFVAALRGFDYQVIPLAAPPRVKVVDVGIQRMLDAILAQGRGDVILASHDIDFHDQIEALLDDGRRVAVLCFRELLSAGLHEMEEKGLQIVDLEDDFDAFKAPLPRLRIIDLDAFDPTRYL